MAFVVPDVVRFTVNQTLASKNVANVLDFALSDPGVPITRADTCQAAAEQLLGAWNAHLLPFCVNNLRCENVSWVDLDNASGSTGTVNTGPSALWPQAGASTAEPMTSQVAVLVHKNLGGAQRGQRRGRMYLAGMTEAANTVDDPRGMSGTLSAAMNTALENFLDDVNQDVNTFSCKLVVVHILTRDVSLVPGRLGSPLTGSSSEVTSLTCDSLMATQRRRLR